MTRSGKIVSTARVRRTSGLDRTRQEGHGEGHRGIVGDRRIIPQPVKRTNPRPQSFSGWSSDVSGWWNGRHAVIEAVGIGQAAVRVSGDASGSCGQNNGAAPLAGSSPVPDTNTNPRPEQSGHRNALSPTKWVSPGQRAAIRCCIEDRRKRPSGHPSLAALRHDPHQSKEGCGGPEQPHPIGRFLLSSLTPCVPVTKASGYQADQRERQAGYQNKYPGLVAVQAVGPAGVGDAPGNGRSVGWNK